jgi:kinesin family protein 1
LLKESQVLSLSLGKKVVYQFAMMTHEPFPISQYEQNVGTSDDSDDLLLYEKKPAVAVKVLDFNTNRIYFWSLSKFKDRLRIMRSLRDTVESPFLGHDSVKDNPFVDQQPPQYSLIGITDVPLFAVSQQRSQRMKLDIYSPHTFSIVAELDVSVIYEPAITGEEQSFDIHLHTVQGFNDFLGNEFHVQADLSNAGLHTNDRTVFVSKKRNLSTGSTLKYDQRFTVDGEESVQQLGYGQSRVLRFEIFAKPKVMLLESLSSWDELRSHDDAVALDTASTKNHVVSGTSLSNLSNIDERHDVIARIEVQEMAATGKYEAVECRKANDLDTGVFVLHLGVQRRLRVFLLHSSGKQLQFKRLSEIKAGSIREVDSQGRLVSSSSGQRSSSMRVLTSKLSAYRHESRPVDALTTFETSLSDADLMDRKTPPGNRIVVSLTIGIEIERVLETIPFSMDVAFEVHSRNSGNPGWLAMFTPVKPLSIATYGLFELVLTPAARRGRRNQWKRSSAQVYIRGEEVLGGWNPRGLSLVEDYHAFEKNVADTVDLEIAKCLAKETFEPQEGSEEEYQKLLQYCIDLWKKPSRDLKVQVCALKTETNVRQFNGWSHRIHNQWRL